MAQVREWRELHLPTFPTSVVEKLRDTIPYPAKGSSTADDTAGT
jgi:hypothetical protein